MTRNPFKQPILRREYDAAVAAYNVRHRDLFLPSGERRGLRPLTLGSSFAQFFWRGYDQAHAPIPQQWDVSSRQMIGWAYYRAGRDIARAESLA